MPGITQDWKAVINPTPGCLKQVEEFLWTWQLQPMSGLTTQAWNGGRKAQIGWA